MNADARPGPLHLVLGDEELLVDRAVASIVSRAKAAATTPGDDLPVTKLRAGDVSGPELAELLSPSLFAEDRVVVLEAAAEAGKDACAVVVEAASSPADGAIVIVVHSGGGRAKALVPALQKAGAEVHECLKLTKASDRIDFVRHEFKTAQVRIAPGVVNAIVESVGSELRELAAACSQLIADTAGKVDVAAVRRYYSGKAEISGFDVADHAVLGDKAAAMESLRWATQRGVAHVLLADALADAIRTIALVGSAGRGDPFRLASELGMPPWKIKKAQAQARSWNRHTISRALQVVAQLNADVKGQAADADYAVERAVADVVDLAAS